jgi:hypothetical protein
MPKLKNMLGDTGTVTIAVPDDEPLIVEYRRGAVTPRLQGRLADLQAEIAASGEAAPGSEMLGLLCQLYAQTIVSWNLTDDDGAVIPTDAEHLADVDFGTLNMVMEAIGAEVRPDPLSGSGSSNGSSPTAVSGPLLITTAS